MNLSPANTQNLCETTLLMLQRKRQDSEERIVHLLVEIKNFQFLCTVTASKIYAQTCTIYKKKQIKVSRNLPKYISNNSAFQKLHLICI